jgi:large subunit ribosomal protein L21
MYAVVETGGKQYRVSEGDVIDVERLSAAPGQRVTFERVLALVRDGDLQAGTPTVEGARVGAVVVAQRRGRKILVFKYKAKVNYRKRSGHRQELTRLRIERIAGPGEEWAPVAESAPEPLSAVAAGAGAPDAAEAAAQPTA